MKFHFTHPIITSWGLQCTHTHTHTRTMSAHAALAPFSIVLSREVHEFAAELRLDILSSLVAKNWAVKRPSVACFVKFKTTSKPSQQQPRWSNYLFLHGNGLDRRQHGFASVFRLRSTITTTKEMTGGELVHRSSRRSAKGKARTAQERRTSNNPNELKRRSTISSSLSSSLSSSTASTKPTHKQWACTFTSPHPKELPMPNPLFDEMTLA